MYRLIRKDFIAGWIYIGIATLVIPFLISIALLAMMDDFGGIAIGFITILTVGLCIAASLISVLLDTNTNIEITYSGFPIERSEIVIARYVSSFIMITYCLSLAVFNIWILSYMFSGSDRAFNTLLSLRGITGIFVFILMVISLLYPFIFKFGISKGAVVFLSTTMVIGFIDPLISFLTNALSGIIEIDLSIFKHVFETTIDFIKFLPSLEVYLLLISVLVVTVTASILLSVQFFSKRDL